MVQIDGTGLDLIPFGVLRALQESPEGWQILGQTPHRVEASVQEMLSKAKGGGDPLLGPFGVRLG